MKIFEVRVRMVNNDRPWDQLPCRSYTCEMETPDQQMLAANWVAQTIPNRTIGCLEVRWNWQGNLQGHYVKPQIE